MPDVRKAFWNEILELAREDEDVVVLTGDLGFSFMERFEAELPDQIINCGIAEQNMVGVASGMAIAGKKPYCYSNCIFLLMRAYEQVRDDVCYNNTNVTLVGTGAAGFLGFTHNLSDKEHESKLLDQLPHMRQYYPENDKMLKSALLDSYEREGPTYIRL